MQTNINVLTQFAVLNLCGQDYLFAGVMQPFRFYFIRVCNSRRTATKFYKKHTNLLINSYVNKSYKSFKMVKISLLFIVQVKYYYQYLEFYLIYFCVFHFVNYLFTSVLKILGILSFQLLIKKNSVINGIKHEFFNLISFLTRVE